MITFSIIAFFARSNQVIQDCGSSFCSWHDMIRRKFYTILGCSPTILASKAIPFKSLKPKLIIAGFTFLSNSSRFVIMPSPFLSYCSGRILNKTSNFFSIIKTTKPFPVLRLDWSPNRFNFLRCDILAKFKRSIYQFLDEDLWVRRFAASKHNRNIIIEPLIKIKGFLV